MARQASQSVLTDEDIQILEASTQLSTGGMAAFTAHFFSPMYGKPRWDLIDKPIDERDFDLGTEYVPWIPLPWQLAIAHDERLDVTVIGGFGAQPVTSRVFDAELGGYVTIAQLIEERRAPLVLSKSVTGWVLARASEPYYEGKGPMYRITTESGRVIDASPLHRLLTTRGYVRISDLRPGDQLVAPDSLPASVCSAASYAPIGSGSPSSCQGDYSLDLHQYDVPPHHESEGDLSVQQPSLSNIADRPLVPDAGIRNRHLPKQGSICLSVLHAERGVPRRYRATSGAPVHSALATQVLQQYEGTTSQYWQGVLGSEHIDLVPMASSCDDEGHILWTYHNARSGSIVNLDSLLCGALKPPRSHVRQQEPATSLRSYLTSLYDAYSSGLPPCNADWWHYTTLDSISEIEYIGEMDYYDLHVPGYANYIAEGVVHHNCGKTVGLGAILTYFACLVPNFKAMDVAPTAWQAKQMFDGIRGDLVNWENRETNPTHCSRLIVKMVERPYPKITFYNGSTIEFMSADEDGKKILSWSGDMAVIDEAGKLASVAHTDLEILLVNLGSRLRGVTSGRERIGKLIVASNADYDPALWDRFDEAESDPQHYVSILLTTWDNPYLAKSQVDAMSRRISDPAQRRQFMSSERPLPRGKEFSPELLERSLDKELDELMDDALVSETLGYETMEIEKAGMVYWVMPPTETDRYIIVGDPGQSKPPYRNSAVVMVFKVTDFPTRPATLAAFWWGPISVDEVGNYWPFLYQMESWHKQYHVVYAGYDATGIQKGFNELHFAQRGVIMEGINMQGQKMRMVLALKLLMGQGKIQMPGKIKQIWVQLANWHMPDKKLRQDIASCLFMVGDMINRLFLFDIEEDDEDDDPYTGFERVHRPRDGRALREVRHGHIR